MSANALDGTDPCAPAAAVAASATSAGAATTAIARNTMAVCMDVDAPDQSLPPLADICSKILGIGTAERSWNQVKFVKTRQRGIAKL